MTEFGAECQSLFWFPPPNAFHINNSEESSSPAGLNNWLSVYCTVTLCCTLIWSPHMSWPLPLTPLASSHTQSRHCKNERFKRPQRRFIHWQTRIDLLWPWVIMPKHFSGIYPSTPCWKLLEGTLHEWAKGDHNTCAFARAIHSLSHQVRLRECLRALSLSRLTVCVEWLCILQANYLLCMF